MDVFVQLKLLNVIKLHYDIFHYVHKVELWSFIRTIKELNISIVITLIIIIECY